MGPAALQYLPRFFMNVSTKVKTRKEARRQGSYQVAGAPWRGSLQSSVNVFFFRTGMSHPLCFP